LLLSVPNLELLPISESELCCGSAGSYNLEQPEIAGTLGERKARNILATGADIAASGNIGCLVQLRNHLGQAKSRNGGVPEAFPVWHTLEVLDRAYRNLSLV
jgi:glycolate oxidase iron-sulfur subunit